MTSIINTDFLTIKSGKKENATSSEDEENSTALFDKEFNKNKLLKDNKNKKFFKNTIDINKEVKINNLDLIEEKKDDKSLNVISSPVSFVENDNYGSEKKINTNKKRSIILINNKAILTNNKSNENNENLKRNEDKKIQLSRLSDKNQNIDEAISVMFQIKK